MARGKDKSGARDRHAHRGAAPRPAAPPSAPASPGRKVGEDKGDHEGRTANWPELPPVHGRELIEPEVEGPEPDED